MARRILKLPEVQRRIPISRAHLWRLERDGHFPKRIQLAPKSVGWFEDEIDAWLEQRGEARAS